MGKALSKLISGAQLQAIASSKAGDDTVIAVVSDNAAIANVAFILKPITQPCLANPFGYYTLGAKMNNQARRKKQSICLKPVVEVRLTQRDA
ncbi:hypothetical protein P2G88_10465 [Aliiglaciecola sp. CAU 1673]|uniref:hypothetical protein n=1 Tax=Aliiglaciecola sp. CAU 1673 TaxID=3032595 RepID=UPI0023D97A87|nr:hypothetical protein [Aliiglaciecola sp. CAU 1673]MDF2178672.1 hypothetical protein [Aliiglaciecola sp. CAU 1673]